jgi:UDP-GlcNAc:undecaprenyl-phosphate/decaprenyl-phosphate GlcNAc-1-phosphate transferase
MFLNFFLLPLLVTVLFILILYPFALKIEFTDKPCHRKRHQHHTPLIGGIAIYLAILVTLFLNTPFFPNQNIFIAAITLLVIVGLIDDYQGLSVKIRFINQIAVGLIMAEFAHIKVTYLGDLFGFGNIPLGDYATAFTVFVVVGGINAFNMIDGIDGLAGSLTLVSITSIALISWIFQDWILFKFCLICIATILGFLLFNLRIFGRSCGKIFLGDTGSTLLGFTVCWSLISISQGERNFILPATTLWIIAVPLLDTVCIMLRRLTKNKSPFSPDREHLHYIFHIAGYSVNQTLTFILLFAITLSFIGIIADLFFNIPESLLFGLFIGIFIGYYWLIERAWMVIKVHRYLHVTKISDRRNRNQTPEVDMRSKKDRRLIPNQQQLEKFHKDKNKAVFSFLLNNNIDKKNK